MKGMLGYLIAFVLLIVVTVVWSSYDSITPTIAQAQAEMAVGVEPVQVIEKGASWILKLLAGAMFAGIAAAVYSECKKAYRAWIRSNQMKRWAGGPNAQWKQQNTKVPQLKREDLMLLALMQGKMPNHQRPKPVAPREQADDDLPLEF